MTVPSNYANIISPERLQTETALTISANGQSHTAALMYHKAP